MKHRRSPHPAKFNPKLFERRVAELFAGSGKSIRQIGVDLGMKAGVLSRIGAGETVEPRLPTLWSLADYFDVSIDFVACRSDVRMGPREREILEIWGQLQENERRSLLATARRLRGQDGQKEKIAS